MLNISKLSTKEIVAKLAKLTGMDREDLVIKTRDELKAELVAAITPQPEVVVEKTIEEKLAECEIDDTNLFGDDGADEDIVTETTVDETAKGRSAKFADKKLRKAFRHFARRLANKKNVAWVQVGEDYEVDGEIISWEKFVADHAE